MPFLKLWEEIYLKVLERIDAGDLREEVFHKKRRYLRDQYSLRLALAQASSTFQFYALPPEWNCRLEKLIRYGGLYTSK